MELRNSEKKLDTTRAQSLRSGVQFEYMVQNLPQVLFEIDTDGYWSFLNDSWTQLSGFAVDACLGTQYTDYVHPQDRHRCKDIFTKMQGGKVEHCTDAFRFLTFDGKYLWTEIHAALSRSPENQPAGIVGTINNITDRVSEEKLLLASQRTLTAMLDDLPGMVYRCRNNPDWTMEYVSGCSHQLTGYYPKDIIDNKKLSYASMIHPDDEMRVWGEVQNGIRENRRFEVEYRIITEDSREKWVWEGGKGIFSNNNELLGLEGMIIDITLRKMREQNQLKNTLYDGVTGLPSPHLFMDRLQTAIRRQGDKDRGAALFVIHFDRILNALDSVDSDAADNLDREVGSRLVAISGSLDSITCLDIERWGLLVETTQLDKTSATTLAQKIQDAFLSPIMISNSNVFVTTSIGVAFCKNMNQDAENMLRNAIQAMHHANALGGGRCELFDARIHKQYITGA